MSVWKVGDVTIRKVVERVLVWPGTKLVPAATPEVLAREASWLRGGFSTAEDEFVISIHSFVIESRGKRIVVDTCVGNDKDRAHFPEFTRSKLPFLERLAEAGCPRESVDHVVCTHLHVDHVGWNTMLERGAWVPTFPNARYALGGTEWDFFSKQDDDFFKGPVEDSVRPIVADGLSTLVDENSRLTDEVFFESTPGHTPGHLSIRICSRGEDAVITGDMMHHPILAMYPEWDNAFDLDTEQAKKTRRQFCERHAALGSLVLGTHFGGSSAGRIVKHGGRHRIEAIG